MTRVRANQATPLIFLLTSVLDYDVVTRIYVPVQPDFALCRDFLDLYSQFRGQRTSGQRSPATFTTADSSIPFPVFVYFVARRTFHDNEDLERASCIVGAAFRERIFDKSIEGQTRYDRYTGLPQILFSSHQGYRDYVTLVGRTGTVFFFIAREAQRYTLSLFMYSLEFTYYIMKTNLTTLPLLIG